MLIFDSVVSPKKYSKFLEEIKQKQLSLKLKSFSVWNHPDTSMEINYFTELFLKMIKSESFVETTTSHPEKFFATKLLVELGNFSSLNPQNISRLFLQILKL